MGRKSQRKGRTGEKELAAILNNAGYTDVKAGEPMQFGSVPDVYGLDGIHIECKRVEKLNLLNAIDQAERDAARFMDGEPAVFHRRNRAPWIVSMPLESWLKMYAEYRKKGITHDRRTENETQRSIEALPRKTP